MKESEVTLPLTPETGAHQIEGGGDHRMNSLAESVGHQGAAFIRKEEYLNVPKVVETAPLLDDIPSERVVSSLPGEVDSATLNAVSRYILEGKRVLVVAPTEDARRSFVATVQRAGLAPVALDLDTRRGLEESMAQVRETVELGPPIMGSHREAIEQRDAASKTLQIHLNALGREVRRTGVSGYEALAQAITSGSVKSRSLDLSAVPLSEWDRGSFERARAVAARLDECVAGGGHLAESPWRGCATSESEHAPGQEELSGVRETLSLLQQGLESLAEPLGFSPEVGERSLRALLGAATIINSLETDTGKAFTKVNLRSLARWQKDKEEILEGLQAQLDYEKQHAELRDVINFKALKKPNLEALSRIVAQHKERGIVGRFFDGDYFNAVQELSRICHLPEGIAEVQKVTDALVRLQALQDAAIRTQSTLKGLFRDAPLVGDPEGTQAPLTQWRQRAQVAQVIFRLCDITKDLTDSERSHIFSMLRNPQPIYDYAEQICAARDLFERYTSSRESLLTLMGLTPDEREDGFRAQSLATQSERFQSMVGADEEWRRWREFSQVQSDASAVGLSALANAVRNGLIRSPSLAHDLQCAWYRSLAAEVGESLPSASRHHHEKGGIAHRLIEADMGVREANARDIALSHWRNIPRYDTGGEAAVLHDRLLDPTSSDAFEVVCREAPHAVQGVKPLIVIDRDDRDALALIKGMRFDLVVFKQDQDMPTVLREMVTSGGGSVSEFPIDTPTTRESESKKDTFHALLESVLKKEIKAPVRCNVPSDVGPLDLVVFDPRNTSRPALVILLDKPRAVAGAVASEREVSREIMSRRLTGRAPLREWIVDWYGDPSSQVKRFVKEVRAALADSRSDQSDYPSTRVIDRSPLEEDHLSLVAPYQRVILDGATSQMLRRHQGAVDQTVMRDVITSIIQQEGPIHRDDVLDRYAELSRSKGQDEDLQVRIIETIQQAIKEGSVVSRGDSLSASSADRELRPRLRADQQGGSATFVRIPPEELEAAVRVIVKHSHGIPREELPIKVARTFGYKRLPCGAEAVVTNICNELLRAHLLTEDNGLLRVNGRATVH